LPLRRFSGRIPGDEKNQIVRFPAASLEHYV
jgi:hypothetical protein